MYRMITPSQVLRIEDGTYIPFAADNLDFLAFLEWEAQGNTAAPIEPAPVVTPTTCTRKQGNMALYEMGYLDEVQAIIAAAPENVRIAYNDAATFERADPFLQMMASDIGLTDAQLDQLFALAVTL